jgi:hypothetical protein
MTIPYFSVHPGFTTGWKRPINQDSARSFKSDEPLKMALLMFFVIVLPPALLGIISKP